MWCVRLWKYHLGCLASVAYPYRLFQRPNIIRLVGHLRRDRRVVLSRRLSDKMSIRKCQSLNIYVPTYLKVLPCLARKLFHGRFEFGQPQEVHITILLLILLLITFGKFVWMQWIVNWRYALKVWVFFCPKGHINRIYLVASYEIAYVGLCRSSSGRSISITFMYASIKVIDGFLLVWVAADASKTRHGVYA